MARLYDEVCGSQNIMLKHIVAYVLNAVDG
jgi:hypothetical protein